MPDITLLLHNIRSTHNVGAIFRTADGFGVKKIILSGYTPHPTYPGDPRLPHLAVKQSRQINKTALGATASVPFEYHDKLLTWLETSPLPLVSLEQSPRSVSLPSFKPPSAFALLLGEEVEGVSNELLDRSESIIEIPMHGMKESFNVSVSAGIALYALTT